MKGSASKGVARSRKIARGGARSKSWNEKLAGAKPAHIAIMKKAMWGMRQGDRLFIATPGLVADYMRGIRKGSTRDMAQMRRDLAATHGADGTCPMTAGIFARIVAEAAVEDLHAGAPADKITPFWRLIDETSPVARKLSCGPDFIAERRRSEASGVETGEP